MTDPDDLALPWQRAERVVVDGAPPTADEVARLRRGVDLDVVRMPGGGLGFLAPIAELVRTLWISDPDTRDLAPVAGLIGLRSLSLELRHRAPVVDLSRLAGLESVSYGTKESWRAAGSALSAPILREAAVWHPEAALFAEHPTAVEGLRLVACRALSVLPPLSDPRRLRRLWVQEAPQLDLADIGRFMRLERLTIEHSRRIVGFGALRELGRLRSLTIGAVQSIDQPSTLRDLPLADFHEWSSASDARTWWLPDLDWLQAHGVQAVDPAWRAVRAAYEDRWMRRTGRAVPRHFADVRPQIET